MRSLNKEVFLKKYPHVEEYIEKIKLNLKIYKGYIRIL